MSLPKILGRTAGAPAKIVVSCRARNTRGERPIHTKRGLPGLVVDAPRDAAGTHARRTGFQSLRGLSSRQDAMLSFIRWIVP